MKTLRIFFITLFVSFAFLACEKSDIKPRSCGSESSTQTETANEDQPVNGRLRSTSTPGVIDIDTTDPNDIVGGGDDDREGGDKKSKSSVK